MGLEPFMLPSASMNLLKDIIDDISCHAELWNNFKVLQQLIVYFATSAQKFDSVLMR
jgi:hypothetical protein